MKPLLLGGVLLLAGAGTAGALYIAPIGGEEEVVSQVQETSEPTTAPADELPEGWIRLTHPGTAEAPRFSFAYPGEWYVKGPELIIVDPPSGEPGGTAVHIELSTWDQGQAPSYPLPPEAVYLKVFVGPYAPLERCGPDPAGDAVPLEDAPLKRIVFAGSPPGITRAIIVYAINATQCYALDVAFSQAVPDEETFNRIVDGFRVGKEVQFPSETSSPTLTPTPAPTEVATTTATPAAARSVAIPLRSFSDSAQLGTAVFTESGDGIVVEIASSGDTPGARSLAQIRWTQPHDNQCEYWQSGAVVYELDDLIDGRSVTRIEKRFEEVLYQSPLVIVILQSEQDRILAESSGVTEATKAKAVACGTVNGSDLIE